MMSNRLAFGAVSVACLAAAGIGGYVATRQSRPVEAVSKAVQAAPAIEAPAPARPAAVAPAPAPAPASRPVAAKPAPAAAAPASRPASHPSAPVQASVPEPAPEPAPALTDPPIVPELATLPLPELPVPFTPPPLEFEELVVPRDSVIGLQNETPLSSAVARVEDRVEARVTRDVRVGGQVAIPAGSRALGSVTFVEQGGKFRERAQIAVRFDTLVLADGTRLAIDTETISRQGDAPNASAKIGGGAVAGAILGAIIGGAKGAAVGATAGAGAGTAAAVAGGGSTVEIPAGTPVTVRILAPITVTIEP